MSIQPRRPFLELLREALAKAEADPDETPALADLTRIVRARIAELEYAKCSLLWSNVRIGGD